MKPQKIDKHTEVLTPIATRQGSVVWIEFNRPEKANAMSSELLTLILDSMARAEACPEVKAVILKGSGKNFCAGADLAELISERSKSVRNLLDKFRAVTDSFEKSPLVVVAAVHGAARAGGLEFILACDGVVASQDATIGDAHILRELLPAGGSSVRLTSIVGHQKAKWLILSGQSLTSQEGMDWGLVNKVVPENQLDNAAMQLANELSVGSRNTIRLAKRLMTDVKVLPYQHALENEIRVLESHSETEAFENGISRFLKR